MSDREDIYNDGRDPETLSAIDRELAALGVKEKKSKKHQKRSKRHRDEEEQIDEEELRRINNLDEDEI